MKSSVSPDRKRVLIDMAADDMVEGVLHRNILLFRFSIREIGGYLFVLYF